MGCGWGVNGGRSCSCTPVSESGSVSDPQGFLYPTNRFLSSAPPPPINSPAETERESGPGPGPSGL